MREVEREREGGLSVSEREWNTEEAGYIAYGSGQRHEHLFLM